MIRGFFGGFFEKKAWQKTLIVWVKEKAAAGEREQKNAGFGTVKTVPYGAGRMAAPVGTHIVRPLRVGNLLPPRITVEISAAARR